MFDYSGSVVLPAQSRAERNIPAASSAHCTAHAVLGEGAGVRFQAESWLELCNLYVLNAMPNVVEMQEQVRFYYGWDPENLHQHIFDVVVTLTCRARIAYTAKPEVRLTSGRFLKDMGGIAWWAQELEFADDVRLITETDINQTDLRNAQMFAGVREPNPDADAVALEVARALPPGGGRSLRNLTLETGMQAQGYRALIRLMRRGVLRSLKHEVIGPKTIVALHEPSLSILRLPPSTATLSPRLAADEQEGAGIMTGI